VMLGFCPFFDPFALFFLLIPESKYPC
jgi:hypothetical protein